MLINNPHLGWMFELRSVENLSPQLQQAYETRHPRPVWPQFSTAENSFPSQQTVSGSPGDTQEEQQ